jgi:NAD(P)-dependent dehydrogenase (short-subunit alcohol dehydrogenase family)
VTSGIGKVTARELARLGARVVTVCRDPIRGEATAEEIRRTGVRGELIPMVCDLSSQASIRRFAATFRERFGALHVLVNNAGTILEGHRKSEDGIEAIFATNHLGPFLLTHLLIESLRAGSPSRVVNVSSEAHRRGHLDFEDLQLERRHTPIRAYCNSKLANILFTFELARRLEGSGVTANCVHPGAVATRWGDSGPLPVRIAWQLSRPFFLNEEWGAEAQVQLATSSKLEGVTGRYFVRKQEAQPSEQARDPEAARALWSASEQLVGLRRLFTSAA